MLDVHPPHEATHTWKDFFIHVATICVGLLIAVGLEQTVEAIHHAHLRRELREALRVDTKINDTWAREDIAWADARRHWAMEQLNFVEQAGPSGPLKLHRLNHAGIWIPNTGVWIAARQNGQAALLTVSEQNFFADLDRVEDSTFVVQTGSCAQSFAAFTELERQLLGRAITLPSGDLDLSALTPEQRLKLDDQLRKYIMSQRDFENDLLDYITDTEYILSKPSDQLEESTSLTDYTRIYHHNIDAHPDLQSPLESH